MKRGRRGKGDADEGERDADEGEKSMSNPLANGPERRDRDIFDNEDGGMDGESPGLSAQSVTGPGTEVIDETRLEAMLHEETHKELEHDVLELRRQITALTNALAHKDEKLTRLTTANSMSIGARVTMYEGQLEAKDKELEMMSRHLFVDSKAHPSKKVRKQREKLKKLMANADPLHTSANTVATLRELERRSFEVKDAEEMTEPEMVWAFVFDMPKESHTGIDDEEEDRDEGTNDTANTHVDRSTRVSHECWMCCERILASDLCMKHVIPIDGRNIIIAVGARHEVLADEAQATKLLMRMQETKGALEFHSDLMKYYASNHGGLNEYKNGNWQRRDISEMESHWLLDDQLEEHQLQIRREREQRIFTTALAQRLVMSRLRRLGRYNPDHSLQLALQGGSGKSAPDLKILKHVSNRAVVKHRNITATLLHDMLTMFGGYRPQNLTVFPTARGEAVIAKLCKAVVADDQFVLKTSGFQSTKMFQDEDAITYNDVVDAVHILERWKEGKGREEVWYGTFQSFFPLHVESELAFLKAEWGNPKNLFRGCLIGYDPECEPKVYDPGPPKVLEYNTFGSAGNILHEHTLPWSLVYQPLEEIRDYFGDDVGLYFSWLGKYTTMLFLASIFGCIVMGGQIYYGGLTENPLTVYYSIYMGLWSILFLEAWGRRENELRFTWGTEQLSSIELPRPQFDGVLETNVETGRSVLEHKSMASYYMRMLVSTLVCVIFIVFTIASALAAQTVRYIQAHTAEGVDCIPPDLEADGSQAGAICGILEHKQYELLSSCLNLVIIGVYGFIFERLADALAEWENHRTQTEFDNSRVAKNFLFQFVNNYFVLFYIAYMREIKDPISGSSHPCDKGNCLPELQMQLLVVFTGKTLGKQIAYTLKPFFFKWKTTFCANRLTKQIVKAANKGTGLLPTQMREAVDQVAATAGGRNDALQQLKQLKKVRNTYELQNRLMPYEGTFDDFNDRVIQFGYLVLFAPAFPLAPFFAFINNVVEIRTGGYKLAAAYQRPVWKARSGIGSWLGVLNVLGFLAVLTNASMITFVGDQDAKAQDVFDEHNPDNGFLLRTKQWQLWLRFVLTEHCVLLMRVVMLSLAPSMPKWILDSHEILEYRMQSRYLTQEHLEAEKRAMEEYSRKMHDSRNIMQQALRYKTEDELHALFLEQDQDQSGSIDERELGRLFQNLNVHLLPKEVANAMADIDVSGDGEITCSEMIDWMIAEDLWCREMAEEVESRSPGGSTPGRKVGDLLPDGTVVTEDMDLNGDGFVDSSERVRYNASQRQARLQAESNAVV